MFMVGKMITKQVYSGKMITKQVYGGQNDNKTGLWLKK
jgi:hypothetical protein